MTEREEGQVNCRPRRSFLKLIGAGAAGVATGAGQASAADLLEPRGKAAGGVQQSSGPVIASGAGHRSVMEKSLSRAGAVGDGKTIDTAAIQDAVSEVERNTRFETHGSNSPFSGAGELIWPQGLFLVDDAIRITRSLRLRGEGQAEFSSGARIQQQRAGKDLFRIEPIAQGCSVGFNNMVLRANGGGASGGALLRITKGDGSCNSIRIIEVVFGTPQTHAIDIVSGDDILISGCLFDASGSQCVRLGGPNNSGKATNVRISECDFFSIAQSCVEISSADSVIIQGNNFFSERSSRTLVYAPIAKSARNVIIRGNTLRGGDCVAHFNAVDGLVIDANVGERLGGGVAPRRALIRCQGDCTGVVVTANRLKGEATMGFYDDSDANVREVILVGNTLAATEAQEGALRAANTLGRIGDNYVTGVMKHGIGYRWTTSGNSLAPGTVAARAAAVISLPVIGARPGDNVEVRPGRSMPDGIIVTAQAEPGAVTIRYANISDRGIRIPPHDLSVLVTR